MKEEKNNIKINSPGQILDYVDSKENLLKLYIYINNLKKENNILENKRKKVIIYIGENYTNENGQIWHTGFKEIYNIIKK